MSSILDSIIDFSKIFLRPIRTKLLYPHVKFAHGVWTDKYCKFGSNVKILKKSIISSSAIDSFTYIGDNSIIKNCTIGKFCSIAPEVRIGLGIHPLYYISTYPGFYSKTASGALKIDHDPNVKEQAPIIIGNDVWIGTRAMILDGVTVGDGAVIGANSFVTKDVEPYSIVGGTPATLIRKRFEDDQIQLLLTYQWWGKDFNFIKQNAELFKKPELFFQFIREDEHTRQ